jgi:DNA-binding response OmpR family regulator
VLRVADLEFDPGLMQARRAGRVLCLPPIPLKLLETLMRAAPRVVKREELERCVWGDQRPDSDVLRAHMHVLRNALDAPGEVALIHTLRGIGYRLAD